MNIDTLIDSIYSHSFCYYRFLGTGSGAKLRFDRVARLVKILRGLRIDRFKKVHDYLHWLLFFSVASFWSWICFVNELNQRINILQFPIIRMFFFFPIFWIKIYISQNPFKNIRKADELFFILVSSKLFYLCNQWTKLDQKFSYYYKIKR